MLVGESDLDTAFSQIETAINRHIVDLGLYGVVGSGLTVAESSPTGLSMDVAAGTAYDQSGRRIRIPSTQTVDLSVDYLNADTAVATVGNARYLSIYVLFDRDLQNPQTDGSGDIVYEDEIEAFRFKVVQGTEGVGPSKPALLSDGILLADILLEYGDTALVNADRDTARRMNLLRSTGSPIEINATSVLSAFAQVLAVVNPHIGGSGQFHDADAIQYTGTPPNWADGSTAIPNSGSVKDALDWLATNLGKKTATSGDDLIGCLEDSSVSPTLIASTLRARLQALRLAANLTYAGSGNWANGASIPAGTIEATIDTIVSTLASTSGSGGALRVGSGAVSQSPDSLTAKSIYEQITDLLTAINLRARKGSAETITGAWTFSGGPTITTSPLTTQAPIVRSGTGAIDQYRSVTLTDADHDITQDYDTYYLPEVTGPPGSQPDRILTLKTSPTPKTGGRVRIIAPSNRINSAIVRIQGSATDLITLSANTLPSGWCQCEWEYNGAWKLANIAGNVTINTNL